MLWKKECSSCSLGSPCDESLGVEVVSTSVTPKPKPEWEADSAEVLVVTVQYDFKSNDGLLEVTGEGSK